MSKSVKRIIGVVASIAIPFAAPAIAGAIGLSTAIGSFAASAVVGAGLGAVNAAATGGNVAQGALFGGIGGGIAGLSAPAGAGANAASGTATSGVSAAPGAAAGVTPTIGATTVGVDAATAASGVANATGAVTQAAPTLMGAVSTLPQTIINALGGPQVAMDMAVKIATQLVAGQATDDLYAGMPPEQAEAFKKMEADLKVKYEQDKDLFTTQLRAAQAIITQGIQTDPNQVALDEAKRTKNRDAAQMRAGLRETPASQAGAFATRQRQYMLDSSKNVATSYMGGYTEGQKRRTGLIQTGYAMLPKETPTPYSEKLYGYKANLADQNNQKADQFGSFVGDLYDTYRNGGSYYTDEAAQKRDRRMKNTRRFAGAGLGLKV